MFPNNLCSTTRKQLTLEVQLYLSVSGNKVETVEPIQTSPVEQLARHESKPQRYYTPFQLENFSSWAHV